MSFPFFITVAAAALLPLAAAAEPAQKQPDPADAQAAVPVHGYQSSFQKYRAAAGQSQSPDRLWIEANRALLGQNGPMPGMAASPDLRPSKADGHGSHAGHGGH